MPLAVNGPQRASAGRRARRAVAAVIEAVGFGVGRRRRHQCRAIRVDELHLFRGHEVRVATVGAREIEVDGRQVRERTYGDVSVARDDDGRLLDPLGGCVRRGVWDCLTERAARREVGERHGPHAGRALREFGVHVVAGTDGEVRDRDRWCRNDLPPRRVRRPSVGIDI